MSALVEEFMADPEFRDIGLEKYLHTITMWQEDPDAGFDSCGDIHLPAHQTLVRRQPTDQELAQARAELARQFVEDLTPLASVSPIQPSYYKGALLLGRAWPTSGDDIARARATGRVTLADICTTEYFL